LQHRPELPDHETVPRLKMTKGLCSRTRESRRGIGRERVKRRPGTATRRIDFTCSVADVGKLSGTVFSCRRGLNYARGCSLRASSAITMTSNDSGNSDIFVISRQIVKTLGREIAVMLRVSTTSASKSAIPRKPSGSLSMRSADKPSPPSPPRRQDHVRWRETSNRRVPSSPQCPTTGEAANQFGALSRPQIRCAPVDCCGDERAGRQ
jgi:hypothetical protein